MNIDVAGEYLLLAATLIHLKTRSLLPEPPADDQEASADAEEADPRAELIRRLLEYQKYRQAADVLGQRPVLGRDVFGRGLDEQLALGPAPLAPVSVFQLLDAFQGVLDRIRKTDAHEIELDHYSISDKITQLRGVLLTHGRVSFEQLFDEQSSRAELIVTFLALLEMTRLGLTTLSQDGPLEPITIELTPRAREQGMELPAIASAEAAFEPLKGATAERNSPFEDAPFETGTQGGDSAPDRAPRGDDGSDTDRSLSDDSMSDDDGPTINDSSIDYE
jgi:segregation and condensation protein A